MLGLVIMLAVVGRLLGMMRSLLRQQLGQKINVEILDKALTLGLTQFEDSELYDKLTRARREASSRPLSMVMRTFSPWVAVVTRDTGVPKSVTSRRRHRNPYGKPPSDRYLVNIHLHPDGTPAAYAEAVRTLKPTALIGVSGMPATFTPVDWPTARPSSAIRRKVMSALSMSWMCDWPDMSWSTTRWLTS